LTTAVQYKTKLLQGSAQFKYQSSKCVNAERDIVIADSNINFRVLKGGFQMMNVRQKATRASGVAKNERFLASAASNNLDAPRTYQAYQVPPQLIPNENTSLTDNALFPPNFPSLTVG
jgi:hypothetical protein